MTNSQKLKLIAQQLEEITKNLDAILKKVKSQHGKRTKSFQDNF